MAYINNLGQVRIGVRGWVAAQSGASVTDSDATAFITAAGITDTTQISALNTLVTDLKTYGLWTKMKALYPFVGGSAASHKFNLKDPRDLDAAYRLVFNGGWVHSINGSLPNGTNAYADTKFVSSSAFITANDTHISTYSLNDTPPGNKSNGAYQMSNVQDFALTERNISGNYSGAIGSEVSPNDYINVPVTDSKGHFLLNRPSSTTLKGYKNGNLLQTRSTTSTNNQLSQRNYYISAINADHSSGATWFNDKMNAFHSIGFSLTDTEASNFYISVQKFQTTLGRHVGTPYVSDPDAIAFLMAAGITDGTQAAAINTLVIRMKADGVWTKMKAVYPFVGGSAVSHKFNLKDPRDLDASYRLQFNGGWTHNSNGVTPNGTNGYARTFFVDTNLSANSVSYSIYNRSITPTTKDLIDFGYFRLNSGYISNLFSTYYGGTVGGRVNSWTPQSLTQTSPQGFYNGNRTNSLDFNFFKNGSKFITGSDSTVGKLQTGYQFHLGCLFIDGQYYDNFTSNNYAFAHIGDGLTDTEATNLYSAVQAYQTTLGRQVNIPLVSDTDAQTFLNAANITSFQQASAVNKLVIDLKAAGVWSKMKAIYPFVGGSATSHKFNLKDPRDLDAAYRLVFNGGWTHTSTGALPNGTTGYADTKLSPLSVLTGANHFSFYNNGSISNTQTTIDIGSGNGDPNAGELYLWTYREDGTMKYDNGSSITNRVSASTTSKGFSLGSRTSNISQKIYKNGNLLATNTNVNVNSLPYLSIYIGSGNINGTSQYPSNKQSAFVSIGDGLTDAEATALYTVVQTYQTSLGRAVDTPVYNNGLVLNLDAGNANSYPGTGTTWFDLASGSNGTLVNGPTYDTANGGSILFDGINDYVNITNKVPLNDTDITYDFWFRTNNNDNVYQTLITQIDGDYLNYIALQKSRIGWGTSPGNVYFQVQGNTLISTLNGAGLVAAGIINYTAVAKKESGYYKLYLYRNGVLDNSMNTSITTINMSTWSNLNTNIGRNSAANGSYGEYLNGNIYSGKVWSRALSSTEILNNFNSTRGRFGL